MLPEIKALGANLVVISPQLEQYSRQVAKQNYLTFEVLSDPGNRVAALFGVAFQLPADLAAVYKEIGADLERFNGDDAWTLPMPGRFVIRQDSLIAAADVDPDYTDRPEPERIIAALKTLALDNAT